MNETATRSSVQRVLAYLLAQEEPATRPMAASACELSRPTVFSAMDRLERLGLVASAGRQSGRPGRSADLFEVPRSAGALVGIDVGGSNIRVAVTDLRGRLLAEDRAATARQGGRHIVEQAVGQVHDALRSANLSRDDLRGVGVSVPGVVGADHSTVRFASNIDQFEPFDFRSPLSAALGAPVSMDNNVNLAALGEHWVGAARKIDTFAVVAVGAGIGAGIVHEGSLLRGAHGAAGEVAFLPTDGGAKPLDVRAHDAAGGLSLLQAARERTGWSGPPPRTVEELFERAARQEAPATDLFEEECHRIAVVIAAVCTVVDPQAVILTGGVGGNPALVERARQLAGTLTLYPPDVIRSALGDRASVIGATQLARREAHDTLLASLADG